MNTCQECKHRQLPNGKHPQRGWCGNPKSDRFDGYVYKGDTCVEYEGLRGKVVAKEVKADKKAE